MFTLNLRIHIDTEDAATAQQIADSLNLVYEPATATVIVSRTIGKTSVPFAVKYPARFSGETYVDRLPSHSVKDILQSMRDYEQHNGGHFTATGYAEFVNMRPDWALEILRQLEDSGDVMSSRIREQLWHVLA